MKVEMRERGVGGVYKRICNNEGRIVLCFGKGLWYICGMKSSSTDPFGALLELRLYIVRMNWNTQIGVVVNLY